MKRAGNICALALIALFQVRAAGGSQQHILGLGQEEQDITVIRKQQNVMSLTDTGQPPGVGQAEEKAPAASSTRRVGSETGRPRLIRPQRVKKKGVSAGKSTAVPLPGGTGPEEVPERVVVRPSDPSGVEAAAGQPDPEARELPVPAGAQPPPALAFQPIGLPGFTWGNIAHELSGDTGTELSAMVNQGIDWIRFANGIVLNTFAEFRFSTRTKERRYFDESGSALGLEFRKSGLRLGGEYSWEKHEDENESTTAKKVYLSWYYDWTESMTDGEGGRPSNMQAFVGSTYGRITHDPDNATGTGIAGYINQGIDWFTLPGGLTFNTYAEYRFRFRTEDNFWYDTHGPALGLEFRRSPFKFGLDHYREYSPERCATDNITRLYLRWYYTWDFKQGKGKISR